MISSQSHIHPSSKIRENVTIEAFSSIYENVEIGKGTWIGPNVTIFSGTKIGENCKIFPGAVLGAIPQDLKYEGENTSVEIGDNTIIRECVTINKGTQDKWVTKVGNNCLLMAYTHIAHDAIIGNNCILANQVSIAGHVEIEDWAILEGLVAVQQFVKIGSHAFIAGASLVRKNIPPFVKAAREPISYIGVNTVGLKRRDFSIETIRNIEDIYRILYVQNQNVSKGLEQIKNELSETPEMKQIISFIENSPKGIMKGIY